MILLQEYLSITAFWEGSPSIHSVWATTLMA